MLDEVDTQIPFPELELKILEFWDQSLIPEKMRASRPDGERWVVFEGPPTANNRPALHHVWTSLYKDVYPRFQVMRGKRVERRGGWDCQGLPVELQIEKELGLTRKDQIEEHGIGDFNERCRSLVQRYVGDFERLFRQIGYWVDLDSAYRTMDVDYIESVWWHIKTLWEAGLVYEGRKVLPYCTRCETALSSHELGQPEVYQEVPGPSVYVRFPLVDSDLVLVVWTTTPWTLISNVAIALDANLSYGVFEHQGEKVVMSPDAGTQTFELGEPVEKIQGSDLLGRAYIRPFEMIDLDDVSACRVIEGDDVDTGQGTGLVHIAPSFGESDHQLGLREGLPSPNHVTSRGTFAKSAGPWAGLTTTEANPLIIEDLELRGLLLRSETRLHSYPHCWRCKEPLIYWAKPSWFIRTSERKQSLIDGNEKVTWYPENIKYGRFGNWLENNIDWALSRSRYWGTPLPIWRCAEGHDTCIGSREELSALTGADLSDLDPHRPAVDEITFACPQCSQQARRLEPVCDVWLDSGCMPAAQQSYPLSDGAPERFANNFPADFICESLDQTRGWFYSLLAVNTLVFGERPFRNAVCLGLLVDDEGRKMSKSRGNVIDPNDVVPRFGADAVRWYLVNSGSPWVPKRISFEAIEQGSKRVLRTFWNSYAFFVTYANLEGFAPSDAEWQPVALLDRWLASREAGLITKVTESYEAFNALAASQYIDEFVDDLSNWYIRRSRERFWGTSGGADVDAFRALHSALLTVAKMIAPVCPFISEAVHHNLADSSTNPISVHLSDWPAANSAHIDLQLEEQMKSLRRTVTLARSVRMDAKIKIRQPLNSLIVCGLDAMGGEMEELLLDEVNVKELRRVESLEEVLGVRVAINYRSLGSRLGSKIPLLQKYLDSVEPQVIAAELETKGHVEVVLNGEAIQLDVGELSVSQVALDGWAVSESGALGVAISLEIDESLREEGVARELVRLIQKQRQTGGLEVSDRIELWVTAPVQASLPVVAQTVLAEAAHLSSPPESLLNQLHVGDGFAFRKFVPDRS